jgi:(p)ppGpp synthase/HD superfamily hydrolase
MTLPEASPSIVKQAQGLIHKVMTTPNSSKIIGEHLPSDVLMAHRPQSIAESYRHGQAVAHILAGWEAGAMLQAAGLLHSFAYKKLLSIEQIAAECDPQVAFLCDQYWRIVRQIPEGQRRGKPQATKRVKLYIAAYCDFALALLGAANLWDHFIVARQSDAAFQRIFADEAQDVIIPLLEMLGMWGLKTEIEAWLMQRGQHQQDYHLLVKRLTQMEETRVQGFERVKEKLQAQLPRAQLSCHLPLPAQIYDPRFPEKAHPEALQKLTVNILMNSEEECYLALRWIHRFWAPVEHGLLDYIGQSKLNGYRSLQTTVIIPLDNNHIRTQFIIRTHEMEKINQWGLLALQAEVQPPVELSRTWWRNRAADYAKICSAPLGALPATLYVFSPQGELFPFRRGCTVVDYAYQVHSELAHQCKRFKVNGEVVSPTTILRHLDLVELERDPQFPGPTLVWLAAARTERARSHIGRLLKRQKQDHLQGRAVLDRQLRELEEHYRIGIPSYRLDQALNQVVRQLNFERLEKLLAEIAAGRVATDPILHPLFSEEVARQVELPPGVRLRPNQLSLAQCCKPRPGDEIVGRARQQEGRVNHLKIHRADCPQIRDFTQQIVLKWRLQPLLNVVARLEVTALAEDRLLSDALQVFEPGSSHVTLHKVDAIARHGMAHLSFTVEARNRQLIDKIAQTLRQLPGYKINEVRQMALLFSEREELVRPMTATGFNPYRRHPVQEREMFFGRAEELARCYNLLRSGVGVIFVQGQKRVGKTSLLFHLKKHYLNHRSKTPVFIDFQLLSHIGGPSFYYEIASAVYNDLQVDHHLGELEPPLRELFEMDPTRQLMSYLKSIQSHFGFRKLVLLIDEFSRTIDTYQQNNLDDTLFQQWRGIIQATIPQVSYVMVVQQQTYDRLQQQTDQQRLAPIWHLLELGETMPLRPLNEQDAYQLIERPTYNHLEYSPEALHLIWRLTGGSPFLIQAFCFNLVRHMTLGNRREVEINDVEAVQLDFMHPGESLFAHLLDMIQSPAAEAVCRYLSRTLHETDQPVSLEELHQALLHLSEKQLDDTLEKLVGQDILVETKPEAWQFTSLLFGRWLAVNRILEQHGLN